EPEEPVSEGHLTPSNLTPNPEPEVAKEEKVETPVTAAPAVEEPSFEPEASGLGEVVQQNRLEQKLSIADSTMPFAKHGADPANPSNLDQFSLDRFYVQPLIGADRFLLIDPHLLEIIISEKMVCRKGTISSFTGNLEFKSLPDEQLSMVEISGSGILF